VLDRVAKSMQASHARVAAPGERQPLDQPRTDQLIDDEVGHHANEREVARPLPQQFVTRRKWHKMAEALDRDRGAVTDETFYRLWQRHDLGHLFLGLDDADYVD
jgi:hypothetical protein